MKLFVALLLSALSLDASSIVIRHDVDEKKYLLKQQPGFLVDMHHEGHGVLIHPKWILTAGHVIFHDYRGMDITVAGQRRKVVKVVVHPDYRLPDPQLFKGDSGPLMDFWQSRSDIALIELDAAVDGVTPLALYSGPDEKGLKITIIGRGATGDGNVGERPETKKEGVLRQCTNVVEETIGNWVTYRFDAADAGEPLEGMSGSGDSGGPSITYRDGKPMLVGLTSWQYWRGNIADFTVGGKYGTRAFMVRVSSYRDWIDSTVTATPPRGPSPQGTVP
ncbi:MAG TPA: trypsin-like serine protease [Telluria sp.]|nr:trypsin-like serine protease [Telluria sp.]